MYEESLGKQVVGFNIFGLGLVGRMSFHGLGFPSELLEDGCVAVHGDDEIPTDGSRPLAFAE